MAKHPSRLVCVYLLKFAPGLGLKRALLMAIWTTGVHQNCPGYPGCKAPYPQSSPLPMSMKLKAKGVGQSKESEENQHRRR